MEIMDTGSGFRLVGTEQSGTMRWQVTGDLDLFRSTRLMEMVEGCVLTGCLRHTVDLTRATSLDSSGIRELVHLHKLLRGRGELTIRVDQSHQPGRLLASTGANRILHVAD
jgi:anti-anti-sigma factor